MEPAKKLKNWPTARTGWSNRQGSDCKRRFRFSTKTDLGRRRWSGQSRLALFRRKDHRRSKIGACKLPRHAAVAETATTHYSALRMSIARVSTLICGARRRCVVSCERHGGQDKRGR